MDKEKTTIIVLGLVALVSAIGGMVMAMPGWETLVGTIAGGLLGYLKGTSEKEPPK